ncbi:MAG: ATP-binding protein [Elusimicrobiales bacterium]|nr:ATP-binding protein [Elusimicrobiales bacterium]
MTEKETAEMTAVRGDAERMASLARLASGFAHDINNMLGAIEGYAVLARASLAPGSQARKDMESISEAVKAAAELTSGLLLFGRRRALKPEACQPGQLLEAAAARARAQGPAGVVVKTEIPGGLAGLLADRGRFETALDALVKNALTAMPAGGQLTLGAEQIRAGGPAGADEYFLRFFVRDTGPGMTPEVLEHLFEPYFSGRPEGKGLGLALVYGIAALHGGWAEARSEPGRGSEVSLCLPAGPGRI